MIISGYVTMTQRKTTCSPNVHHCYNNTFICEEVCCTILSLREKLEKYKGYYAPL